MRDASAQRRGRSGAGLARVAAPHGNRCWRPAATVRYASTGLALSARSQGMEVMIASGEEYQRARALNWRPPECQHPADQDDMVPTIMQGMALTFKVSQRTRNERHAGNSVSRFQTRPLVAPRLSKAGGHVVLRLA